MKHSKWSVLRESRNREKAFFSRRSNLITMDCSDRCKIALSFLLAMTTPRLDSKCIKKAILI